MLTYPYDPNPNLDLVSFQELGADFEVSNSTTFAKAFTDVPTEAGKRYRVTAGLACEAPAQNGGSSSNLKLRLSEADTYAYGNSLGRRMNTNDLAQPLAHGYDVDAIGIGLEGSLSSATGASPHCDAAPYNDLGLILSINCITHEILVAGNINILMAQASTEIPECAMRAGSWFMVEEIS